MRKSFKFKLQPTKKQAEALTAQLSECARLYNAALQERRDAYRMAGKSINWYEQKKQLKEIRAAGDVGIPNYAVASDVLKRVDLAFQSFFRRVKAKNSKAGFPRFRSSVRYDSFTFTSPNNGYRFISRQRLFLQGVGNVKLRRDRPVDGKIKTCSVKREGSKWWVMFSVECEAISLPQTDKAVGLDVGLKSFVALSTGLREDNPRFYKQGQKALRVAARKVSRRKKGSNRRKKAVIELQQAHAHIRDQRNNFHHELSRRIVNEFGVIVVEDLNVKGLASSFLAKSVVDAGWGYFISKLAYKAESAGREFVKVNPSGTSQTCLCGASVPKTLATRWHLCETCGASEDRDVMSAKVILERGLPLTSHKVVGYDMPAARTHNELRAEYDFKELVIVARGPER